MKLSFDSDFVFPKTLDRYVRCSALLPSGHSVDFSFEVVNSVSTVGKIFNFSIISNTFYLNYSGALLLFSRKKSIRTYLTPLYKLVFDLSDCSLTVTSRF